MTTDHSTEAFSLLKSLGDVIHRINNFTTIESLLAFLQGVLETNLGTKSVWIFTLRPGEEYIMDLMTTRGSIEQRGYSHFTYFDASNDAMIQSALRSDQPIYVHNALTDERTDKDIVNEIGARSLINCRIVIEGELLGVFGAGTHYDEGFIDINDDQLAFFKALTEAVGICLDKIASNKKAQTDTLTKLCNRDGLSATANKLLLLAKRHFRKVGVLYFDLDNFKPVNDKFGHNTGDKALQAFADVLQTSVRGSDIIARIGGDEFVVILNDIKSDADIDSVLHTIALKTISPIVKEMSEPLCYSVGTAVFPQNGNALEALIAYADDQMYSNKRVSNSKKKVRQMFHQHTMLFSHVETCVWAG